MPAAWLGTAFCWRTSRLGPPQTSRVGFAARLALKEIAASGRRVPDDMLVTGVNDIGIARLVNPSLTTVRQPGDEIAKTAVETLKWRIANPVAAGRLILLDAPLVVRESTAAKPKKQGQ